MLIFAVLPLITMVVAPLPFLDDVPVEAGRVLGELNAIKLPTDGVATLVAAELCEELPPPHAERAPARQKASSTVLGFIRSLFN
jgi:hypothetical protein